MTALRGCRPWPSRLAPPVCCTVRPKKVVGGVGNVPRGRRCLPTPAVADPDWVCDGASRTHRPIRGGAHGWGARCRGGGRGPPHPGRQGCHSLKKSGETQVVKQS